ncbi:MAG: tripartite tricarboxylate transporter permease [Deltaproteobacteria bacterium]|nr:tripartite tricarboxylate transporter permease [Deltaproteobacteria bacterium]
MEYLEAFYKGLIAVLPVSDAGAQAFGFMLLGVFIGFWVGILPGLGGAATLALMLPFIYRMDPVSAFAFLLGSNAVTATTGDITSVLFGVPGEGTTAATVVDGHPMAKKGEAGRALGAALMSSLVGAIFGAFALALAIPIVRPLVLSIGAPEFFMLAVLGITFVASLSGGNLAKGLTAGGFGLVLAMVGLDPIESVPRYTLEPILGEELSLFLWDPISLVAVTIGLFAIPEIIDLAVHQTSIAREQAGRIGGVLEGVKDTFRHWWLVLRCSALGTYIGILPGLGGATAQWVAYAHAVQSSPDKERFSKGAVEGVLGPGAANNSKEGGSLIPTIAFGVPGSVSMAILLGAFIIQGLTPGPDMLNPAKHLTLTFSFVWMIVLSNLITVGICFLFLNQLAKITHVKGTYLIPFILLLVFLGGFTVKNSFGDLILVLLFGVLGWFMVQMDWPRPPLLLGIVLGGIMENNLFISTMIYGASWLLHPGVVVISLLTMGAILYSVYQVRRQRRAANSGAEMVTMDVEMTVVLNRRVYGPLFALFFVSLFAYVLWEAFYGFGADFPRAAIFARIIGIPSLILALLAFAVELFQTMRREIGKPLGANPGVNLALARQRTLSMFGWILGFFLAIWFLGFNITVPLATFLYLKVGAGERWAGSLILSFLLGVFFYGLFDHFLHLPFPEGELFLWVKRVG